MLYREFTHLQKQKHSQNVLIKIFQMFLFVIKLLNYGIGRRRVRGNNIILKIVDRYVLEQASKDRLCFLYVTVRECLRSMGRNQTI